MIKRLLFALIIFTFSLSAGAESYPSLADNPALIAQIRLTIDKTYNFEFSEADQLISQLNQQLGDHPAAALLKVLYTYWQYQPFTDENKHFPAILEQLNEVIAKSQAMAAQTKRQEEADFFAMTAYAYLADLRADNGDFFESISMARKSFDYIKSGLVLMDQFPEYYFTSGVYNYYRVRKPEEVPLLKSIIWLFPPGDKAKGIEYLKQGSQKAMFTRIECYRYLFHIYLRYENDPVASFPYIKYLIDHYPGNLLYTGYYTENLYRLARFEEMSAPIAALRDAGQDFYQILGLIFQGLALEQQDPDLEKALDKYLSAERLLSEQPSFTPHFASYLFAGIGRIYAEKKDSVKAGYYFDQASQEAEYDSIRNMIRKDRERYPVLQ